MDWSTPGSSVFHCLLEFAQSIGASASVSSTDVRVGPRIRLNPKELMVSNCGAGELLRVPWTSRRSNQSILKKINLEYLLKGLPRLHSGKESASNIGDIRDEGLIPWLGRFPGVGNGNLLQYSCLKNPMDTRNWQATVYEVTKCWNWLSDWAHTHLLNMQIYFSMDSMIEILKYEWK